MQRCCYLMQFFTNAFCVPTVQNVITGSSSRTDTITVLNELFRYVEKKMPILAVSSLFITRKHRNENRNNK